jgi:hypothetical protein
LGLSKLASAWTWVHFPQDVTGNADMSCPEQRHSVSTDEISEGFASDLRPVDCRVYTDRVPQFLRCGLQKARCRLDLASRRAVYRRLPWSKPTARGIAVPYFHFQPLCVSALRRSSRALTATCWPLRGGPDPLTLTPERVSNVQQNAHRRVASRRNQGGRRSR